MKASDSTNSLTGLTEVKDKECFICLEDDQAGYNPLVHSQVLRNCGCRFHVHPDCWNEWIKGKTDYDCPICRKDSIKLNIVPNPVLEFQAHSSEPRQTPKLVFVCLLLAGVAAGVMITSIVLWGK
jgi:hypothetical protein